MNISYIKDKFFSFVGFFIGNEIALFTFLNNPDRTFWSIVNQGLVTAALTIVIMIQIDSIVRKYKKNH